jgi:hypothetical protein
LVTKWVAEKIGKKILGENDVEAVLQRLDRLTQEEAKTTATQTLEVVYGLVKSIKVVMDGARSLLFLYAVLNVGLKTEVS